MIRKKICTTFTHLHLQQKPTKRDDSQNLKIKGKVFDLPNQTLLKWGTTQHLMLNNV